MQISTWNVNSIRTRIKQVLAWLEKTNPDVLCLQETKVDDPLFPVKDFEDRGYQVCFHGQKSYNGVALISRLPLNDVRVGLTGELLNDSEAKELEDQKRVISALVEGIRIVNVYVPNGSSLTSTKYQYKISWLQCLKRYLDEQQKRKEPLCLLGDFNIALEARDLHNPQKSTGGIMASEKERQALLAAIEGRLTDVFRLYEQETNHWSWWDYRSGAWDRDKGWRIDHIYLCNELIQQSESCYIHKQVRGNIQPSDHAPVLVDICWPPSIDEDPCYEEQYIY